MGTAARDFKRTTANANNNHQDRRRQQLAPVITTQRRWQFCRLCASEVGVDDDAVDVFGVEGRRHYLQTKIRKYLYVLVTSEDSLSKMVCSTCIKRLEGVHRFAMMAYRTQERLKLQLHDTIDNNTNSLESIETDDSKDGQDASIKKIEDRGLLHSILTKGAIEILAEGEPLASSEVFSEEDKTHTSSTEEMEVKVDPMLFLQCGMDHSTSEMSDMSDSEDTTRSRIRSAEWSLLTDEDTGKRRDEKRDRNDYNDVIDDDNDDDHDVNKKSSGEVNDNSTVSSNNPAVNTATKPHECTICSRSFVSQIGLQNHLWSHLPKERKLDGKPILRSHQVYSTNGVLHTSPDNNSSGNFVCPICSKKISTKGNLKVHLETHRPKGKYGCDICGRIFKTQTNLFRHKEYHGGIQFPCNVCGRVYPTNSTLRAHSITHSDLRPHACPLCDKTFKRNQDLKFHINQHTGARPYQCPYCPKAFASSGNCFSHRKRMHPREVHRDRQRAADLMR